MSKLPSSLSPHEIAQLRKDMHELVKDNIHMARAVLEGRQAWTNNQIKLFALLCDKVIPDLHHSYTQIGVEKKAMEELTRDELEQIARLGVTIEGESSAVIEPSQPTQTLADDLSRLKDYILPIAQQKYESTPTDHILPPDKASPNTK